MSFGSATISIGDATEKSDYDVLMANTVSLRDEVVTFKGAKTFQSSTVFNAEVTTAGDVTVGDDLVVTGGSDLGENGIFLKIKVIEIGNWDMVATHEVSIAHGLTLSKIRSINVMIRNDFNNVYIDMSSGLNVLAAVALEQRITATATHIILYRDPDGYFDTTDFDASPCNRGWITIVYQA